MEAVGRIGYALIFVLFLFLVYQPIGLAAVTVWRTAFFADQRKAVNGNWAVAVPPGYVLEVGTFFVMIISTVGWFFWLDAKADIDPWYDVVVAMIAFVHILFKTYLYLVHTTRHPVGAAATIAAAFIVATTVWAILGSLSTWKAFWWWGVMPPWLLYISMFSAGIAVHAIPPLPAGDPAVPPAEQLKV